MNAILDVLAEEIFDYVCAHRKDNLNKDGSPGDPRKIAGKYEDLMEPVKHHYRSMAEFFIERSAA